MRVERFADMTLYCGKAIDVMVLSEIHADALVCDPPYGLGEASGTISKARASKRAYSAFDDTPEYIMAEIIPAYMAALAACNGRGITTPGAAMAWNYPKPNVLGGFYLPASVGMCLWGRVNFQPIFFHGRDPRIGKTIQPTVYTLTEKASVDWHPCAKPMKAWKWVVNRASLQGETVLDPFMGSGTTGVACVELGRKFIGIELDEIYFDKACKRIEMATRQNDMFLNTRQHTGPATPVKDE